VKQEQEKQQQNNLRMTDMAKLNMHSKAVVTQSSDLVLTV